MKIGIAVDKKTIAMGIKTSLSIKYHMATNNADKKIIITKAFIVPLRFGKTAPSAGYITVLSCLKFAKTAVNIFGFFLGASFFSILGSITETTAFSYLFASKRDNLSNLFIIRHKFYKEITPYVFFAYYPEFEAMPFEYRFND